MDFIPEKSALEVDEICEDEKAMGCLPSRPSGEGAGTEGAVEDANNEVLPPIAASEVEEPAYCNIPRFYQILGEIFAFV
jgi:hypothetical protein